MCHGYGMLFPHKGKKKKKELPANYANRVRLMHSFTAHHSFFVCVRKLPSYCYCATQRKNNEYFLTEMFFLYFAGRSLGKSSVTTNSKLSDRNVNKY